MDGGVCWLEGRISPLESARIPVIDHGLLYGDGVFEGIRFYHGRPFLLGEHVERFRLSARALALACPHPDSEIEAIVGEVIAASGRPEGYLRMILTRGNGPLGIDPAPCGPPRLLVIAAGLTMVNHAQRENSIRLVTAATRSLMPDGLDPRIKGLNYLNRILARLEARTAGVDEAVLLNHRGGIAEATAENLFLARNGVLRTPPPVDGALPGITRGLILELARNAGIEAEETSLSRYDLHTADECFLTGTGAGLVPVREIDGRPLRDCPGPVFRRCRQKFEACIQAHCGGPSDE